MILKKSLTTAIIYLMCINGVFSGSYSKVYVNSGSNVGPYQYVGYGTPPVAYGAPIAQLTAAPAGSVVPYSQPATFVQPCIAPCVPQQPAAKAALVAYTVPRAPVAVASDVPSNYEYSYAVYDDGTGDQKVARELSNGGVVSGQYSFLQPDGYVREVQYTADDVNGFSAVVNYLPGNEAKTVEVKATKPCPEVKPEALKEQPSPEKLEGGETAAEPKAETSAQVPTSAKESAKEVAPEEKPAEASDKTEPAPETLTNKEESLEGEPAKVEEVTSEVRKTPEPSVETVTAEVKEEKPVEKSEAPQPVPTIITNTLPLGYVSYDQLIQCIQKMQNANIRTNSPLTYILLPSNSKPC